MLLGLEPLARYEQNQHCGPGTIGPGAVGPALLGLRCHWSSGPGAVGPDAMMQAAAFRPSGRCRPGPSSTQAMAGAVSPISARGPRLVQQITTPPPPTSPSALHGAGCPPTPPPPPVPTMAASALAGRPREGTGTQGRPSAQRWRSSGICKNSRGRVNRVT